MPRTPEQQLKRFVAKFEPSEQSLIRACRTALRKRLPGAYELVYDNYNFLVLGYSPTERPSDSVLSLAARAGSLGLCFIRGAQLPDPEGVLEGSGKQTRFIRLHRAADLKRPVVESLIQAALAQAKPFEKGPVRLVIRSISANQRPRRKLAKRLSSRRDR